MKTAVTGPVTAQNAPCVPMGFLTESIAAYLIPEIVSPLSIHTEQISFREQPTEAKNPSGKNSVVTSVNIDIVFACRAASSFASLSVSLAAPLSTELFN